MWNGFFSFLVVGSSCLGEEVTSACNSAHGEKPSEWWTLQDPNWEKHPAEHGLSRRNHMPVSSVGRNSAALHCGYCLHLLAPPPPPTPNKIKAKQKDHWPYGGYLTAFWWTSEERLFCSASWMGLLGRPTDHYNHPGYNSVGIPPPVHSFPPTWHATISHAGLKWWSAVARDTWTGLPHHLS